MTGIISSSPNKTSQPCSSAQTSEPSRNTSVKRQLNPVEEEEEDDDDDDVSLLATAARDDDSDDVSLLAAADEDDEVDDMSLLAAEMVPESTTKQEKVVDYLEGMTAEMFGADDVFDSHNEDDDVEALPDAHYGLLGTSKELLQPDGSMDDLPEEILREILCQIPARDLYCNISLVCQRWRSIVQDPKVKTSKNCNRLCVNSKKHFHFSGFGNNYLTKVKLNKLRKLSIRSLFFLVCALQETVLPLHDVGEDHSRRDQPHPE